MPTCRMENPAWIQPSWTGVSHPWSDTYLVVSRCVAELAEGGLVAVWHVGPAAEEYQSTGVVRQGAPKHFNAALLLAGKKRQRHSNEDRTLIFAGMNFLSPLRGVFPEIPGDLG